MVSKIIAVRPPSRSGCAAVLPRYGTCSIVLMPAMLLNSSAAMCSELPLPLVANEALSGLALIQAISSWTFFAGTAGCTASSKRHDVGEHDRLEIRHRIVGQLLEDELVGRVARSHDHQLVAVGRALGDEIGAEIVGSARLVLDHHRLAHRHRHLVGDQPRDGVDGAAWRCRHDDLDRPRGIGLRTRAAGNRRKHDCDRNGRNAMALRMTPSLSCCSTFPV